MKTITSFKLLSMYFLGCFTLLPQSPPANDDICNAEELFMFDPPTGGSTVDATDELGEINPGCFTGANLETVWYKFTAPNNGNDVRITTDFQDTFIDTQIAVYEAPDVCTNLFTLDQEIACESADNGDVTSFSTTLEADNLTIGETYYIQVDKEGTTPNGLFEIAVESIPPNDDLCDSETIFVAQGNPSGNDYTLLGASEEANEPAASCFDDGINGSVWFDFVAPPNGEVTISTDLPGGSLSDSEIAVYEATGDCADLSTLGSEVGCNQDISTGNFLSSVNLTDLNAGDTYYLQVDRWGTADDGRFGVEITTPAPNNDDICDAIEIGLNDSTTSNQYSNLAASSETDEPVPDCFFGGVDNSVWFKFTAPSNADEQELQITTDFAGGTLTDTEVAVYSAPGDCTDPNTFNAPLFCDQDSGTNVNFNSVIDVTAVPGFTYYVQVDNAGASGPGSFGIELNYKSPANDDVCDAIDLPINGNSNASQYDNFGSTQQTNEPVAACFDDGINGSVWFTFTAPSNGEATVTTDFTGGSLTDTEIAVYEAPVDCSNLNSFSSEIACDQDSGTNEDFNSVINLNGLTSGDTYYIQVDRWGTESNGTFGIEVQSNLSTDAFTKQDFTYYPNPTRDILNIESQANIDEIEVYDLSGKMMLSKTPEESRPKINLSDLASGVYMIKLSVDGSSESFRVIKE